MRVRTVFLWLHLLGGVLAGAVILLMCVTGVALTYERQLIEWADHSYHSSSTTEPAEQLPMRTLLVTARSQLQGATLTSLTVKADGRAPVAVTAGPGTYYVDPYSGRVLGESAPRMRRIMSELRAWHRWIAAEGPARQAARAITGWSNLLFLFIIVTGIYLWFPRTWRWSHVKAVTVFNGRLRGKARDFNWHNVIGSWSAVPLAIVVLSAIPISFPWANAWVFRVAGDTPPAARGAGRESQAGASRAPHDPASLEDIDRLLVRARQQEPGWRTISVRLTGMAADPLVFAIDRGDGGQPHLRSTLTLARGTGEPVAYEPFSAQSRGRQIRSMMRFAHTGEVLGIPGQTVAGLVTAGGMVLVYTGIALALRRLGAWRSRRIERTSSAARAQRAA